MEGAWSDILNTYQRSRAREAVAKWRITASQELPGSTHWDPATVPVGEKGGGGGGGATVVHSEGIEIPFVDILWGRPDVLNEGQPPIIYSPPPILLPGQVDPGREEQETEEGPMAHTWTHLGSQFIGALFPNTIAQQSFVAGPGQVAPGTMPVPNVANGAAAVYSGGTCPPRKTRTLTIDCETGLEVKRTRRRRPKLLTSSDMAMLFQIATLPNNANVRTALARAVRR